MTDGAERGGPDGARQGTDPAMTRGLDAARVSWSIGGRLVLDGVDCIAPAGAVTGLLGPNGSGKSTLLRVVAAAQHVGRAADDRPTRAVPRTADGQRAAGTPVGPGPAGVRFDDTELRALPRRRRAQLLALVEQDASTELPISVLDAVLLGRIPHRSPLAGATDADHRAAREAITVTGLEGFADREITTLSGGERQRAHLARALAQEPRLLLVDEPTNHLDVAAQLQAMSTLRKLAADGVTVLTALHDLNLAAATCDHVVLLSRGRVVAAGPPPEVLVPDVLDAVYGVRCDVLTHPRTGRPVLTFAPGN